MAVEDWQYAGFALYVHWPFCASKCPYCDFNSHVVDHVDQSAWADALVSEIRRVGAELGPRALSSIFFGGGTPSLMPAATVAGVIDAATDVFS
ncbi:MAG: radical SAM protein, partial [Pseudomonadota bacterium]